MEFMLNNPPDDINKVTAFLGDVSIVETVLTILALLIEAAPS
jgi:hypothetical protein